VTYVLMWIGSLALAGVGIPGTAIGFAGFFSKDVILESAFAAHTGVGTFAFWLGIAAAFMTAFYSWRLLFMTFHGTPRCDEHTLAHVHESPKVMILPLFLLAAGALFSGVLGYHFFVGDGMEQFWGESINILPTHQALEHAHDVPFWVKALPLGVGIVGIALAWWMYIVRPGSGEAWARALRPFYLLSLNKWYFDEIYDRIFVRPSFVLGRAFWKSGDGAVIDGVGPDGVAATTVRFAKRASALQSGYVYHYAFAMLVGVVILITWYFFSRT
jgi:NADH-quinone oxidoreductase subunit L